jgi:hypothetical protein
MMSYFESHRKIGKPLAAKKDPKQWKKEENEKYTDSLFPPVDSSLFLRPKPISSPQPITWKRLSDIYNSQNVVLLSKEGQSAIKIELDEYEPGYWYVVIAFNALKHCKCILERIFEEQSYNDCGLYLLKIFQQNNWKSIILDDFAPVRSKLSEGMKEVPVFIDAKTGNGCIEIWPFLLLKAFANYYSTYEMMNTGNLIDFLNELTGCVPLEFPLKKNVEKTMAHLKSSL